MNPNPTIGRVVHYVLSEEWNTGIHRPAIVVEVDGEVLGLRVICGETDNWRGSIVPVDTWRPSVHPDEDAKAPGTWHWPERE